MKLWIPAEKSGWNRSESPAERAGVPVFHDRGRAEPPRGKSPRCRRRRAGGSLCGCRTVSF